MNIIIVATDKEKAENFVKLISSSIDGIEINVFVDGISAIKYIYQHNVDMVFTTRAMKYMRVNEFSEIVHKHYPLIDISILDDSGEYANDFENANQGVINAGANRLVIEPLSKEVLQDIVNSLKKPPDG